MDAAVVALRDLAPAAPPAVLFNEYGRTEHAINVQIGVCVGAPPLLTTVAVVVKTEEEVTDILRQELATALVVGDVQTLVQSMTLNEAIYEQVREAIVEKLGPRRHELVVEVDLEPAPLARRAEPAHSRKDTRP